MQGSGPTATTSGVGSFIASFDPSPQFTAANDKPLGEPTQALAEPTQFAVPDEQATEPSSKLTVALLDDKFKLALGGAVIADFFFNTARPVAPGAPYYLTPGP